MPEAELAPAQVLCPSAALVERGTAFSFEVLLWQKPARAFALRFDGQAVAYLNRCAHVPVEMDWQPGEFFDQDKRWLVCSIHGASYEPSNGICVGGPCRGQRLMALRLSEADGLVHWHPTWDIRPAPPLASLAPESESTSALPSSDAHDTL
ncbi:Rieske (2Fe-2S) protein [Ideonella sp.]|uniref:Rieske (2Fe-2S) protein n=1 Tax=Ideonella sp. TaxID=1929293 RepID=UPI003BB4BD76